MVSRIRRAIWLTLAGWLHLAGVAAAHTGVILAQELDASNPGYSVPRVWGCHYETGYARANLLADYIVGAVEETKVVAGAEYSSLRSLMVLSVRKPAGIEQEFDGMLA